MLNMSIKINKIEDFGWDSFFQFKRTELGLDNFSVARAIAEYRGTYKVKNANGEYLAKITGKQMFKATSREDYPAVGDWVAITELDNKQAIVQAVLPRKSIIKRRFGDKNKAGEKSDVQIIATNIDVAFIVQSVGRDYSINRFDRYLAIIKDSDIKPAIIINKTDLISAEELDAKLAEIKSGFGNIDVFATSTKSDESLEKLKGYIQKGETCCFLGSSGVGKSSLINALLGESIIKTEDVSSYSGRGKHITTSREMYFLESGGIVIDNPGIREVGLTDANSGIEGVFDEMAILAKKCKYADCTHTHEPGCEILAALTDGRLDEDRYSNYINLKKEAQHYGMSELEKREKGRSLGKFINKAKKELKNYGHKDFG
jgi:ribosome biogenesis GTPase / thiamine phosphate phosphatase